MENKGLFETYRGLLSSLILFVIGCNILISKESNENDRWYGWLILSISFGFLITFIEQWIKIKKLKTGLNILSYVVPAILIIYRIVAR